MPKVNIDIKTDIHSSDKKINKVDDAMERVDKQAKAMGSTTKGLWRQFAGGQLAVAALSAGFRALKGVLVKTIENAIAQQDAVKQLETVLISTKGAVGLTSDELTEMASGLQNVTKFGDETIISAQSMLLTFTRIGKEEFPDALEATLNLATAMKTDLKSASIQVGKALNDPKLGLTALTRSGITFTEEQKDVIKAFVDTGDVASAQKMILKELETQFGGSATAARETFGGAVTGLNNIMNDLLEEIGLVIIEDERFKEGIEKITTAVVELIESGKIKEWVLDVIGAFSTFTTVIGGGIAAFKELYDVALFNSKAGLLENALAGRELDEALGLLAWEVYGTGERFGDADVKLSDFNETGKDAKTKADEFKDAIKTQRKEIETAIPKIKGIKTGINAWGREVLSVSDLVKDLADDLDQMVYNEALPASRDLSDAWALASGDMRSENYKLKEDTKDNLEDDSDSVLNEFLNVSERIKDSWIQELSSMLQKSKSLKDGLKSVWGTIKTQFFDLVAKMITKWTLGFITKALGGQGVGGLLRGITSGFGSIGKLLTGKKEGTGEKGTIGNITGSFLGGIGKMVGIAGIGLLVTKYLNLKQIGQSVSDALSAGFEAVGSVLKGLGSVVESVFGTAGTIVSGIGQLIGGLMSGIGKLVGGGGQTGNVGGWIHETRNFLADIKNIMYHAFLNNSNAMVHSLHNANHKLAGIWKALLNIPSAQTGFSGTIQKSGLMAVHEGEGLKVTPKHDMIPGSISGEGFGGRTSQPMIVNLIMDGKKLASALVDDLTELTRLGVLHQDMQTIVRVES
tara:strand:- start:378 stop:2780 length:2403 start_codon:yes stop_codon:yes gene_type:complete